MHDVCASIGASAPVECIVDITFAVNGLRTFPHANALHGEVR
jgi:hypothetical protein